MKEIKISIAEDFTKAPAGRYKTDGPYSGERFRDDFLIPALQDADRVIVDLDNTLGYGSSFLEEAFGGLIREKGFTLDEIKKKIEIINNRTLYARRIDQYLADAEKVTKKSK